MHYLLSKLLLLLPSFPERLLANFLFVLSAETRQKLFSASQPPTNLYRLAACTQENLFTLIFPLGENLCREPRCQNCAIISWVQLLPELRLYRMTHHVDSSHLLTSILQLYFDTRSRHCDITCQQKLDINLTGHPVVETLRDVCMQEGDLAKRKSESLAFFVLAAQWLNECSTYVWASLQLSTFVQVGPPSE